MGRIYISEKLQIPESEINYSYARSSGPGGQKVNKTNTKVSLSWSLELNKSVAVELKDYLVFRLGGKLSNDGRIIISSDRFRSQDRNREDCLRKFIQLLKKCSQTPVQRKKTKPTKASKERRLKDKKNRSETKILRKNIY